MKAQGSGPYAARRDGGHDDGDGSAPDDTAAALLYEARNHLENAASDLRREAAGTAEYGTPLLVMTAAHMAARDAQEILGRVSSPVAAAVAARPASGGAPGEIPQTIDGHNAARTWPASRIRPTAAALDGLDGLADMVPADPWNPAPPARPPRPVEPGLPGPV